MKQRTLKQPISIKGVGLHTGKTVTLTLKPFDSGIVYRRTDINADFYPNPNTVRGTQLCTQIFDLKGNSISTVEHINAALFCCGLDNVLIEVDNIEIPILDGSALPFIYLIQEAGIQDISKTKEFLRVTKKIETKIDDKFVKVEPYLGIHIDFTINFNHPFISKTNCHINVDMNSQLFIQEFAKARTFGFMKDIEYLQTKGLCLGGTLDNAVVLDEFKVINPDGLRYSDEFVRHKVLDMCGDMFVCGKTILGSYTAYKTGHELNNKALQEVIKPENHEMVVLEKEDLFEIRNEINLKQLDFSFA